MSTRRGMTTSPVKGRTGIKVHNGKASGLVVKVWDAHAKSLLSFSLNERIHSWTTAQVSIFSIFSLLNVLSAPYLHFISLQKFARNGLQIRRYFELDFEVTAFC